MSNEMINGEYNNFLRISGEESIVANTNTIRLISPSPYVTTRELEAVDGVTVGTVTKVVDGITFTANEYVEYRFLEGDINTAGEWTACLISLTPSGDNKILAQLTWTVDSC